MSNNTLQLLQTTLQYLNQGNLPEARRYCERFLQKQPRHPDGLHIAGVIALQLQNYAKSIHYFRAAIAVNPGMAENYNNLSIALQQSGQLSDAFEVAQQAVDRQSDNAAFWRQLGQVAFQMQHWSAAAKAFKHALQYKKNDAVLHYRYACTLSRQQAFEAAVASFNKALSLNPQHIETYIEFAALQRAKGNTEDALNLCTKALQINPQHDELHNALGTLYRDQDNFELAETHFQTACRLNPKHFEARYSLATLYERFNKLESSQESVNEALILQPDSPKANLIAARLQRRQGHPDRAIDILQPFAEKEVRVDHKALIHFELGESYDRTNDADNAFHYFTLGNQLLANTHKHLKKDIFINRINRLQQCFTPEWARNWSQLTSPPEPHPVFLFGFPRSGTTLMDNILNCHPDIVALEEKPIIHDVAEAIENYPEGLANLSEEQAQNLRILYLERRQTYCQETGRNPALIIDRHPFNSIHTGLIIRLFPHAKFIFALRHPYDVCLSCFMQPFDVKNLGSPHFHTLQDTATLYAEIMSLWRKYQDLFGLDYHTLCYESLVEDNVETLQELMNFLKMPWADELLEHSRFSSQHNKVATASYHQVAEPLYTRARYRWRHYTQYLHPISSILMPWLKHFNYEAVLSDN